MRLIPLQKKDEVSYWAAKYIVDTLKRFTPTPEKPFFVLGLPTGSTPIETYKWLVKFYQQGEISFKNVVTFNMDEYYGLTPDHPQSYAYFMHQHLFDHIDIPAENINLLDGTKEDYIAECQRYEDKIKAVGGIDLFLGGVGNDGHIAFNEPGSSLSSRTRIKRLTEDTRIANSRFFNSIDEVPKFSLTVGIGTLLDARRIMILATGEAKAPAIAQAVEGPISHQWTITALQMHPHAMIVCDRPACQELKLKTYDYFRDVELISEDQEYNFNRDLSKFAEYL